MDAGLRLRQACERLGLTYRDVERASYELASRRGRPEFILHISRLADIENRGVVPGLHKLYTLAALYRLDPREVLRWYDVPIEECFHDGVIVPTPETHVMAAPTSLRVPIRFDPGFDPRRTELLSRMVERWGNFEGVLTNGHRHQIYGYIGLNDRRMSPLLRPGSIVLVDTSRQEIEEGEWRTEHDRPMYFVEVRGGYRCGWFHQEWLAAGNATSPAFQLHAGSLADSQRSRNCRSSDGSRQPLARLRVVFSESSSSSAREFEQNSSLR